MIVFNYFYFNNLLYLFDSLFQKCNGPKYFFIRLYGTLNSVEQEKGFIESIVSFPFS